MSSTLTRIFKDSFYVVVSQGFTYVTSAIWGILLIRWVGPDTFGSYIYYTSFFSIIISVFQFGTIAYLSRELNVRESAIDDFYGHTNVQLKITAVLSIITLIYLFTRSDSAQESVIAFSSFLIVAGDNIANVLTTYNYSKNDAKVVSNVSLVRGIILIGAGFILFMAGVPSFVVIVAPAVISWLRVGYYAYRLKYKFGIALRKFLSRSLKFSRLIKVYSESWVFGCLTILTTIASFCDPIILKSLNFKEHDFGVIAAASRLRGIISLSAGAILNVIFPRLAQDYAKSPKEFERLFISILKPIYLVNMIMCALMIIFSHELILLFFGTAFTEAIPFMTLFSVGTIVPVLTLLSSAAIATGLEKNILISNFVINGLNPVLKFIFIPVMGAIFIGWYEAVLPWISILIFFLMLRKKLNSIHFGFYLQLALLALLFIVLPAVIKEVGGNHLINLLVLLVTVVFSVYGLRFINLNTMVTVLLKRS